MRPVGRAASRPSQCRCAGNSWGTAAVIQQPPCCAPAQHDSNDCLLAHTVRNQHSGRTFSPFQILLLPPASPQPCASRRCSLWPWAWPCSWPCTLRWALALRFWGSIGASAPLGNAALAAGASLLPKHDGPRGPLPAQQRGIGVLGLESVQLAASGRCELPETALITSTQVQLSCRLDSWPLCPPPSARALPPPCWTPLRRCATSTATAPGPTSLPPTHSAGVGCTVAVGQRLRHVRNESVPTAARHQPVLFARQPPKEAA